MFDFTILILPGAHASSVAVTLDILAFPSQGLNFGLGSQTSIVPQSFATSQFFTGQ